jgi:methylmalonyl-CoA mutase N-terminal domain/subunit
MWARMMREEFGAKDPRSWTLRFHTQTAGSMLTSQQPDNNVVRVTIQALAAVMGGTQSLRTNSRDEALGLPSEDSARLALRTQQVLLEESGVADVIDPMGGAPFIEELTDEVERGALDLMQQIEAIGGAVAAIESGWMQLEIHKSALAWQREVERKERTIVGVNAFEVDEPAPQVFKPEGGGRKEVLADLDRVRDTRDSAAAAGALRALGEAAKTDANLMPPILQCVEAYATIGEVADVLEAVFGSYRAPEGL